MDNEVDWVKVKKNSITAVKKHSITAQKRNSVSIMNQLRLYADSDSDGDDSSDDSSDSSDTDAEMETVQEEEEEEEARETIENKDTTHVHNSVRKQTAEEIKNYLVKHSIPSTLNSLLNELAIQRPEKPYEWLVQKLQSK